MGKHKFCKMKGCGKMAHKKVINWKKIAIFSLCLNIAICLMLVPFLPKVIRKVNDKISNLNEGYESNPHYAAQCSMFELNSANADVIFLGDSITARGHWERILPKYQCPK